MYKLKLIFFKVIFMGNKQTKITSDSTKSLDSSNIKSIYFFLSRNKRNHRREASEKVVEH